MIDAEQIKQLEARYDQAMDTSKFIIVRLDGKSFHTWTRGLHKPFSTQLQDCFDSTTRALMRETGVVLGYTQSDEMSLLFSPHVKSFPFDGRVNKVNSVFTSMATAMFYDEVRDNFDEPRPLAFFDCRCYDADEAYAWASLKWREADAVRNSVQALAQSYYPQSKLHKQKTHDLLAMIEAAGDNWWQYPSRCKYGAYFIRAIEERKFTQFELDQLPEKHHARMDPSHTFKRSVIKRAPFDQIGQCEDFSFTRTS
jgi:tRNA(His) guanylyltransferase